LLLGAGWRKLGAILSTDVSAMMNASADLVIIGAGAAGCVLAARLSEARHRSVLLLEAGPDYREPALLPPEIRAGFNPTSSHDWGYASEPVAGVPAIPLWRGRLVGGCSATNGTFALRGHPADYDEWAARGNAGWSFDELLPFFRRCENDLDYGDAWHGREGPLPIRRFPRAELGPGAAAFLDACAALGFERVPDHNAPGAVGAGPLPVNQVGGVRQSTALTYLASARGRANLTVRGACVIDRLLFEGRRAVGVRLAGGETIAAGHVVLAGGAFSSPAILLRSGVGQGADLRDLGISVHADLPGVGRGLADHPRLGLRYAVPSNAVVDELQGCQAVLTMRSSATVAGHDLHVFPWAAFKVDRAESPTGARMVLHAALTKPRSRGSVRLRSADPSVAPIIDPGWFTDPADLPRMRLAVRTARRLAATPPLAGIALEELFPGPAIDGDADLDAAIRSLLGTYFHPVGSCRMGPASDPDAVVDSRGAVHGIDHLSIIDASIMPSIPAANTHLPTIALAERCAAWLTEAI
jgi:choline dehydrogenase